MADECRRQARNSGVTAVVAVVSDLGEEPVAAAVATRAWITVAVRQLR